MTTIMRFLLSFVIYFLDELGVFMKKLIISFVLFLVVSNVCTAETVVFNSKTHKYHKPSCSSAIKCTVNCVKIEKQQAKSTGGVPCKVCGG